MNFRLIIFQALLALAVASCAFARPGPKAADLVAVDLLCDSSTINTTHTITLGVRYRMQAGWHIYWKNAGDAGMPTSVIFDLPNGFKAGALMFPTPTILKAPGDICDYGYENEVVLLTRVEVPADWMSSPFKLSAKTDYLVCEKICVPGNASVQAAVDPTDTIQTVHDTIIKWLARVPTNVDVKTSSAPLPNGAMEVSIRGKLQGFSALEGIAPKAEGFIPGPGDSFTVAVKSLATDADEFTLHLILTPLSGRKTFGQDSLECLLTENSSPPGQPSGLSFIVPLKSK